MHKARKIRPGRPGHSLLVLASPSAAVSAMQELPLVALPAQQQQHGLSVGYPLLSLSRSKEKTMAMAFGDSLWEPEQLWANCYGPIAIGPLMTRHNNLPPTAMKIFLYKPKKREKRIPKLALPMIFEFTYTITPKQTLHPEFRGHIILLKQHSKHLGPNKQNQTSTENMPDLAAHQKLAHLGK